MNQSNFKLKIGNWEVRGIWAIILGLIILIPVLALVGVILSVVFSIVGVVLTIAMGVIGIALLIILFSLLIPKKWREKLGIKIRFNKENTEKPHTTSDGKSIVDVTFKEEK